MDFQVVACQSQLIGGMARVILTHHTIHHPVVLTEEIVVQKHAIFPQFTAVARAKRAKVLGRLGSSGTNNLFIR